MSSHDSLAAALAAVQAQLPTIAKGETAVVPTKNGGKYTYSYADLADVSKVILPLLGKNGLAWITRPTVRDDGKFVLAYTLRHTSGEETGGEYPLSGGTAQEIGSAITYARRYTLCSVTGVAPESDDDDGAAASHRPQRDDWEQSTPAAKPPTPEQTEAFDRLLEQIKSAESVEGVRFIGADVHRAKAADGITQPQYERLARAATARLSDLKAAVDG